MSPLPASLITKLISGGQTGADRGGLDAAIELGIPHGGWCPKGRRAEDGRIPRRYRLKEAGTTSYLERTEKNVLEADGTVVFTFGEPIEGSAQTIELAREHARPLVHIDLKNVADEQAGVALRDWIEKEGICVLNVAGSRESNAPGIGARVRAVVIAALGRSTKESK